MIKYCIFDLDGTLLNTLESITYHLNNTLSKYGMLSVSREECRDFIGSGARTLVRRAMSKTRAPDEKTLEEALSVYNAAYHSSPIEYTEPYPEICELIDELIKRGIRLAVLTNKPQNTARLLIDHFLGGRFEQVVGGRAGAALKPDPSDALEILGKMGARPDECAFIGDMPIDAQTGKNMGAALSVCVSWGYASASELEGEPADVVISEPRELLSVL